MKSSPQFRVALIVALAAVLLAILWGHFMGHPNAVIPGYQAKDEDWEATRIRNALPDADFVYVLTHCPSCQPANQHVEALERANPKLKFLWIDPKVTNVPPLQEILGRSYGIEDQVKLQMQPALYGPVQSWHGVEEVELAGVDAVDDKGRRPYERLGASWDWLSTGSARVAEQFKEYRWYVVALAGLVDGINPCAISTIIFLLSYLTLAGLRRKGLLVGLLFAAGCFAAYLLIGLGLWKLSSMAFGAYWGRRILYPGIAAVAVGVSVLAFWEFGQQLRTGDSETLLRLPKSWLLTVHDAIRRTVRAEHAVWLAAPLAVVVTLIEFGCTGQVYLPIITYVASLPGHMTQALPMLLLYNLAFVAPLLAVVVIHRIASEKAGKLKSPISLKWVRLAEGLLLGLIGVFMLWATYHAWSL